MVQLWEFGAEQLKKNNVRKYSLGAPHLCLGVVLSSGAVPCWPGPWPTDLISCLTSDLPCLYELALVMDSPGNHCSAAWPRLVSPALPRSLKEHFCWWAWCWVLAVTLGSPPFEEKPILCDRWVPRCFGNSISENNPTEYWNPNLSIEINADFVPCVTKSLLRHDLP